MILAMPNLGKRLNLNSGVLLCCTVIIKDEMPADIDIVSKLGGFSDP